MGNENHCVICWAVIPEGRQYCPSCWKQVMNDVQREGAGSADHPGAGAAAGDERNHDQRRDCGNTAVQAAGGNRAGRVVLIHEE